MAWLTDRGGAADHHRRTTIRYRGFLIAAALVGVAAVIAALVLQRTDAGLGLGLLAVGLLGCGVGMGMRVRQFDPTATDRAASPVDSHDVHDSAQGDAAAEGQPSSDALILFAKELIAATTMERFRRAISSHLPALLGTRRVWIASRSGNGRRVVVPEQPEGAPRDDLLDADGREWTTFALRLDDENVGVLGIESSGGVKPRVRALVQVVAPMIAQAMTTAESVETLRETSLVDLLTGLATRHEGVTRLESEIKRAQRSGATMAVLMLDLDQFKSVNDRFGHEVGDAMLGAVGRTIMRTLRASDIRVRWGGEEFLIVLPETDLSRAQVVANGLLREISAATVATPNGPTASTVSIGITISRPGETDASAMIRRADMALYHAKAAGRACIRVVLGDRTGHPGAQPPPGGVAMRVPQGSALPFSERRDPDRSDRRRVPSPGRRTGDPPPPFRSSDFDTEGPRVHTGQG